MNNDGDEVQNGEEGSPSGPSPDATSESVTLTKEQYDGLMGLKDTVNGLQNDLRQERGRRKNIVRSDVSTFDQNLTLSPEDKKKIEEGLNGENAVDVLVDTMRRVVHHEWGKYVAHQTGVAELMERHPDMFDAKTGKYLPNSDKGRLWESIAKGNPELAKNPNGVRVAMEELEDQLQDAPPAKGKAKAKPADEGEDEGEEEEQPKEKPLVGDGGRKPAPPKKGGPVLSKEEKQMAGRYGGEAAYQKAKDSKVIEADV